MAIQTILVIEDDRFIGEMYVRSLRKAGYTVDWLIDGADGLVAARSPRHYAPSRSTSLARRSSS